MKIKHELVQGTPDWHKFRLEHDGASEAAVMLGISTKASRSDLLHQKHTGIPKEFSEWVEKNVLDYGHEVEDLARSLVELKFGFDLPPAVYSDGTLSASCDGFSEDGEEQHGMPWENKQPNQALLAAIGLDTLPEEYMPQCQQILMVTGAKKLFFTVSDGETILAELWVKADKKWFTRIKKGWEQFHADLAVYKPPEYIPAPTATPILDLPAVSIQVAGSLALTDNLKVFGEMLTKFVGGLDMKPVDDQGFANAKDAIKKLQAAQDALEAAEASALAQTASIDDMRRTVKLYVTSARDTRLSLEKMVKEREGQIKTEIAVEAKDELQKHKDILNQRLGPKVVLPPIANPPDFGLAMKNKRTIASLREAVNNELVRAKLDMSELADKIEINLKTLREKAKNHAFLFNDFQTLVVKDNDDLRLIIAHRISEHDAAETRRIAEETERIRNEEEVKARQKLEAEQQEKEALRKAADEATQNQAASMAVLQHDLPAKSGLYDSVWSEPDFGDMPPAELEEQKQMHVGRHRLPPLPEKSLILEALALRFNVTSEIAEAWLEVLFLEWERRHER